ncbi:MAG: hypothetical protein J7M06_02025, partial [Proteobacteria bacterium]|nr:hypothetical protein [Pseudomonadota bacterium]
MRTKTLFACLIFIALTIVACAGQSIKAGDSQDYPPLNTEAALKAETKAEIIPSQEKVKVIEDASSPAELKPMVQPSSLEPSIVTPSDTIPDSTPEEIPKRPLPGSSKEQAVTPPQVSQPAQKSEEIVFN